MKTVWEIPTHDEYKGQMTTSLLEVYESKLEEHRYNVGKYLGNVFQKIESAERETLTASLVELQMMFILNNLQSHSRLQLQDLVLKEKWNEILPIIERIIYQLERHYLGSEILDLIAATNIDFSIMKDYPLSLRDVAITLHALLIEVRIDYELRLYPKALEKAKRSKEILDFAINVLEIAKNEGLPVVTKSLVQRIDKFNGNSIYKVK